MKLSRDTALRWHFLFDQIVPPLLRECRWFMYVPMRVAFREHADLYLDFKDTAYRLTDEEFCEAYRKVSNVSFERETDLNQASIDRILAHVRGKNVLEVGCGKGFLCKLLAKNYKMTAADIVIQPGLKEENPHIDFHQADIEKLPFADNSFDTVVCTHTLEHVRNLSVAVNELRRVAKRLIIIVPRQRPYRYTFDLHLNFFPYHYSLLSALGRTENDVLCEDADGDIFYREDVRISKNDQ